MIGRLFDKFIEWSLNRHEQRIMKKETQKRKTSRVRRKANAKKKAIKK